MRGTPFLKQGFQLGLNTQDSPYTLVDGEARDCLNVVSTSRGAIHKRYGFQKLFTATQPTSDTLNVIASMEGANEAPFAAANFTLLPGCTTTGEVKTKAWRPKSGAGTADGFYYTGAEHPNPIASFKFTAAPESGTEEGRGFGLWLIHSVEGSEIFGIYGYFHETGAETFTIQIIAFHGKKLEAGAEKQGGSQILHEVTGVKLEAGDVIAMAKREGLVQIFKEHGGTWTTPLKGTGDGGVGGTTKVGWSAVSNGAIVGSHKPVLVKLSFGEHVEGTAPIEAITVASVYIGGVRYIIAAGEGKVYAIDTEGEYHLLKSGLNTTAKWEVVQATENSADKTPGLKKGGPIWLVNGVDKPLYWKGGLAEEAQVWTGEAGAEYYEDPTSKEHVPNGKYMVLLGNRIFMAGISDEPYTVRFCGFSAATNGVGEQCDPTNWEKNNAAIFDSQDGEPITGLGVYGKYVLVFKRTKTYVIYDLNEGFFRQVSDSVGSISHRSIVETPEGTFFLSQRGIYSTNGANVREVGYKVRPTIQVGENDTSAAGAYFNNHYYLSYHGTELGGTTELKRTLDYDMVLKSWWLHDCWAHHWTEWIPSTESTLVAASHPAVATAFVPELFADFGATYKGREVGSASGYKLGAYWMGPWEPFAYFVYRRRINAPFIRKRLRQVMMDGTGYMSVAIAHDFSQSPEIRTMVKDGQVPTAEESEGEVRYGNESSDGFAESIARRSYGGPLARVFSLIVGNNTENNFQMNAHLMSVDFKKS